MRDRLRAIWGYPDFRPPQGEIIACLLAGKDALVVLPTGGGKSICFQLPALLQTGLTLVVSPLVALMENQVQELQQRKLSAASFHSEIPRPQRKRILQQLERQQLRLLYLSPETLFTSSIWERLIAPDLKINGLILDEAHCLVQWGETFRPAYRRLGVARSRLQEFQPTPISIAAFTATADPNAQKTIAACLQLRDPTFFQQSPYRQNIRLQVKRVCTPAQRKKRLLHFIQPRQQQSGLIYARSRNATETLSQWLNSLGYKSAAYHGGLSPQERRSLEQDWLDETLQFVIATCAFGMGINKPTLRWVVHYQPPCLLSEYVQEIGRGGRDGKTATALTIACEPTGLLYREDQKREQYFHQQLRQQYQKARELKRQIPPEGEISTVEQLSPHGLRTLSLLHSLNQLEWLDPFHYRLLPQNQSQKNNSDFFKQSQQMQQYLATRGCRWQFLLTAFGFLEQAKDFRCGSCDRCVKSNPLIK